MRALRHGHIIQLYGIVLSSPLMLVREGGRKGGGGTSQLSALVCLHCRLRNWLPLAASSTTWRGEARTSTFATFTHTPVKLLKP